jgi:hypothetical protein
MRRAGETTANAPRLFAVALAASVVSTAIHYTDNYIAFADYPGSGSISRATIPITWVVLTLAGVAGYVLYRRNRGLAAHLLLAVYSITGLATPLHYLYGSPGELPFWRNVSILADGVTGAAVLAFALWPVTVAPPLRQRAAGAR